MKRGGAIDHRRNESLRAFRHNEKFKKSNATTVMSDDDDNNDDDHRKESSR